MRPRPSICACAVAAAFLIGKASGVPESPAHRLAGHPRTLQGKLDLAKRQVAHDRAPGAHHWLGRDKVYVNQLERLLAPPLGPSWLVRAFWCIHRGEGAWNDSGDPYWGGLQMDRSFMLTYGRDMVRRYHGWANVWPPAAQIAVAVRAYPTRGFFPWPNTARACGLL